jgi:Uma2 family endonuclease
MRVVTQISEEYLLERHRKGLDHWDEMWEGVLHLVPSPHSDHGRLNDQIGFFFQEHWERLGLGRMYLEANVKRAGTPWITVGRKKIPKDYKVPDRSFLLPKRYNRLKNGWIIGAPNAVLEIISPGDESDEKLSFYLSIGVREAIYIDRKSREIEVRRAGQNRKEWILVEPSKGWLESRVLDTEFRREPGHKLHLRRKSEPERVSLIGD